MNIPSDADAQTLGLFWLLKLDQPLPPAVEPGVPATFQPASLEESAELAVAMGLDDAEPVLQRFARGCRCFIARIEGRLVSYGWVSFEREHIGSLGLEVHLLPGEAYIWDCATLALYRGQHLYPALLSSIVHTLQVEGFQRVWIGMDADNQPSQAGVARAGFRPIVALLQTHDMPAQTLLVRGYPGIPEQDIQAAQYALLGDREASSITR
jgi:hypothetical protein